MNRYVVVAGSQSAHCCFGASVVDTTRPYMIAGKQWGNLFEEVCECFYEADAEAIAHALNNEP